MAESKPSSPMSDDQRATAEHWDNISRVPNPGLRRFWQCPPILGHINRKLSPVPSLEWAGGLHHRLATQLGGTPLERGLAVGAGGGHKEMRLIEKGLVKSFVLYDLSDERLEIGRREAAKRGLADRMDFRHGDGIEIEVGTFDLVHWDNALHHMPDTNAAVQWSKDRLADQGFMYVYEYTGPNRHQWTDAMIEAGDSILQSLPERFFDRAEPGQWPRQLGRPSAAEVRAIDPSEAADSERIVGALQAAFPAGDPVYLGGAVYHLALNDILENFDLDDEDDRTILQLLLQLDDQLSRRGENHFAAFLAQNEPESAGRRTSRFARGRDKRLNR